VTDNRKLRRGLAGNITPAAEDARYDRVLRRAVSARQAIGSRPTTISLPASTVLLAQQF
jgi:hypothetical protein